jgi:hypothetical protein
VKNQIKSGTPMVFSATSSRLKQSMTSGRVEEGRRMKTLKVVAIGVVLLIAALTTIDGREVQDGGRPEFVGMFVPRAERAGSDDGAAFAIHFAGDTHGSLDPCG